MVRRRRGNAGLTLVELMITMVISGMVAASTFAFFVGQNQIYEAHRRILNAQQNLWAATETLSKFVRMSGTGMMDCVRPDPDGTGPLTGDPPPTGSTPPATGLRAWSQAAGAMIRIAPIWINNGVAGAPDTLRIAYGSGTFGTYSDAGLSGTYDRPTWDIKLLPPPATPPPLVPSLTRMFNVGDFAIVLDRSLTPASGNQDRGCTLFQITGTDEANHLLLHAPTSFWNPPSDAAAVGLVPFPYTGSAIDPPGGVRHFGALNWIEFSINRSGPVPMLMMQRLDRNEPAQPLAEGIEDMQIAYACDGAPAPNVRDGVFTEGAVGARASDEWIFNDSGDAPPVECNRPSAVRLTIMARSIAVDETLRDITTNAKPAVEDGVAGARDSFRHRIQTTVVYARN